MVYRERTPDGITRLTGSASSGEPGTPGVDGKTPQLSGTSTSSVTIGTGSKTFTISPAMNVPFPVGTVVRAYGSTNTNYMTGFVTAATTTSVTINVVETGGVGTFASWTLVVSGFKGATGAKGTRWGTTNTWLVGPQANVAVSFLDGPPQVGDLVVTSNGFQPGAVYRVTAPVDATHADLELTGIDLRGPQGAPSTAEGAYPVGALFFCYGPTDPSILLGFGTWALFGQGQILVGFKSTDTDFDADGKQGGAKTHTLTIAEMPAHDHGPGTLAIDRGSGTGSSGNRAAAGSTTAQGTATASGLTGNRGGGDPHNNMPPYIVVHIWRRTA